MEREAFEAMFGERLPLLWLPFETLRTRFPEMSDDEFRWAVCAPIVGRLSDEFTWLFAKRLGLPPPQPHDWGS